LPIFGLGQALIPAGATERRQAAFWLMVIYVGSALGLLLTTSFLGLRRYLRQRKLQMPMSMTGVWLAIGATLIVLLLGLGAILPRPSAEYALIRLPAWLSSPEQKASRYAVLKGDNAKGQGRPGEPGPDGKEGGAAGKGAKESGGNGNGKGQGQNPNSNSRGNGQTEGKAGGKGQGDANDGSGNRSDRTGSDRDGKKEAGESENRDAETERSTDSSTSPPPSSSGGSWLQGLGRVLKWIVFAIVALVVAFFVLRAILRFFAHFTGWARGLLKALDDFWRGLFGWMTPGTGEVEDSPAYEARAKPRPFASFSNPFADGSASRRSPEEIVRYSFAALEAWAHENGLDRQADDTPLEFADRIGFESPEVRADCRRLATLYAHAAYARGRLPASCLESLRRFWQRLESNSRPTVVR
jgi:hypothetical protein